MIKRLIALQFTSLIMGIIAILSFAAIYKLSESFTWINHTHQVIYQLHSLKDDLADCQTSCRESIFSENEDLLSLYLIKMPLIESELDKLQWLTRDNKTQQENIYQLRLNIVKRLNHMNQAVEIYKKDNHEEAKNFLINKFGEPWTITTRNSVEIVENLEVSLLKVRLKDYQKKSSIVLYGIPLLMILYVLIFSAATKFLSSEIENT